MSRTLRTLLVEDTADDALLLLEALRRDGYDPEFERVQTADTMRAALAAKPWDIILCDYFMPGFDAPAALRIARESGRDVPVIVVSGTVGEEIAVATIKLGAADYLMKDRLVRLGQAVGQVLEQKRLRGEASLKDAALQESVTKLHSILSVAPVGICWVANRVLLEVNEAMVQLLGYSREELTGQAIRMIYASDEDHAAAGQRYLQLAEQNKVSFETRFRARDGRIIDVSLTAVWFDPAHPAAGVVAAALDISERKRGEQALRVSEEKFAKAFRASPDAISVHEMESGRYVDVNPGVLRFFGCPREEIIGRSPSELGFWVDPDERRRFLECLHRDRSVRDFVARFQPRAGPVRMAELSAELVVLDGRPHNVTILRDITLRLQAEQALRASEEKFAKAFRASPDAIAITDLESGRYIEANDGHERVFGFTREEVIGRTTLELGYYRQPEDRARIVAEIRAHGSVRDLELECHNRRREPITVLYSGEYVEINGRPCLLSVVHDMTDRKRAETALRESEEKFAKAFRASPDAISLSERASGLILDVNEGFERLSGFARAELVGRTAEEVGLWVAPGDRARMLDELAQTGRVRNLQVQARSRDGKLLDCLMSAETVEIGGRNCLVILSRDITAARLAEKALRESEEKFAKAFQGSPYSLTISDLGTGRYIDCNAGFERISGYARSEIIGRTSLELNLWQNPADRDELVARLRRDGVVRDFELNFVGRDGGVRVTRCNCELMELEGRTCLLNVIEDITGERQAAQEKALLEAQLKQSQKLEALGTLAGGIAHDFNNILSAMIVYRELAVMDIDRPVELRQHLAEIGTASNRAKELVRQILTFSRQQQQERRAVQLHGVVREALQLLRASLPATIEIVPVIDEQAPQVLADTSQVHQIMMNLGTNAAHAMRGRPGRLMVTLGGWQADEAQARLHPGLRPGTYVRLAVADTGHGMDEHTRARVFEPFFTTKGPGEGTGLGLSVVHGIMEDHDGAIVLDSRPGEGTAFELYFPQYAGVAGVTLVPDASIPRGAGESVLLVDDEGPLCEAMRTTLQRLGYRVTACTDPVEAVARFRAGPQEFDLLVTDHTMPRMTGLDVIHEVHRVRPELPVLLVSGLSGTWTPDKLRGFSIRELVAKPIDFTGLAQAVHRALARPRKPGA